MGEQLGSVDARNKLEDLSGIVLQPGENPYNALIKACNDNPVSIGLNELRLNDPSTDST